MSTVVEHNSIKYRVRVSVGPNAKNLQVLNINDDAHPVTIQSDEFVGQVSFRIRGQDQIQGYAQGQQQDGLSIVPDSPWFHNPDWVSGAKEKKDKKDNSNINSLQIQGRFKREWSGDRVVFAVMYSTTKLSEDVGPWQVEATEHLLFYVDPPSKKKFRPPLIDLSSCRP